MSRPQEIAALPLDVVDDATAVGRAMKRARSVINDNASACLPGSGSMTVI
jgi:hypothetical protein